MGQPQPVSFCRAIGRLGVSLGAAGLGLWLLYSALAMTAGPAGSSAQPGWQPSLEAQQMARVFQDFGRAPAGRLPALPSPHGAKVTLPASLYCTPPLCPAWSSGENVDTRRVAWGDFDQDGDLDLAVANYGGPGYSSVLLYRNENGTLSPKAFWRSGESDWTTSVAWADVDSDGDLDLAVGNDCAGAGPNCRSIRLHRNDGGQLTPTAVWSSTEQDRITLLAWGDYTGDSRPDLASSGFNTLARLYRNDSTSGGLTLTMVLTFGLAYSGPAWADVDGDGDLDLTFTYQNWANLYRNDAGVINPSPIANISGITWTTSPAWGDIDGDGDLDLAVGSDDQGAALFRNDTLGSAVSFNLAWRSVITDVSSVAWGDYDGDGDLDLAAGTWNLTTPNYVYRNDQGSLTLSPAWTSNEKDPTQSLAWADLESDGNLDLAAGNGYHLNRVYRNDSALLSRQPIWSVDNNNLRTTGSAWGDYDGDGDLDLVIARENPGILQLFQNDSGRLSAGAVWTSTNAPTDFTYSVAWGDYDGDGDLDLAAGGRPLHLYQNNSGALDNIPAYTATDVISGFVMSAAWGDYDGDGDLDLAAGMFCTDDSNKNNIHAIPGCRSIQLYRNDHGTLTASAVYSSTETDDTYSVAWADVDGDGDLDLAAGTYGGNRPRGPNRLYRNDNGQLTPLAAWSSSENDPTSSVAWADYDGDGDPDLAVGNCCQQPTRLYRNDGGQLTAAAVWSSNDFDNNSSLAWADYDGDGDPDLVVGNNGAPTRIYRNEHGALTPDAAWSAGVTDATYTVAWGDVDGDGDPDLFTGSWGPFNRLYRNNRLNPSGLPDTPAAPALAVIAPLANVNFAYADPARRTTIIPITYTLSDPEGDPVPLIRAWYSLDGGGQWQPAVAASHTLTSTLPPRRVVNAAYRGPALTIPDNGLLTSTLAFTATAPFSATDVNVWVVLSHTQAADLRLVLQAPTGLTVTLLPANVLTSAISQRVLFDDAADAVPVSATLPYGGVYQPTERLGSFNGKNAYGTWTLQVTDTAASNTGTLLGWGLQIQNEAGVYTYNWDTFASGFFGQSDNVVFRLEAFPALSSSPNSTPVFRKGAVSATTTPFRVRGTQIRVMNTNGTPAAGALVYQLPAGQNTAGALIHSLTLTDALPFQTDAQGYLQGRGQLGLGDRLLALAPVLTSTAGYALYYTNGAPQSISVNAFTVAGAGTQLITVTAQHPLYLFDLDVSLEWDAHNDSAYLDLLTTNLKHASQYLYDFTDGQVALGDVYVYQNTAGWDTSHILLRADDRLRPFAILGGIVNTYTVDSSVAPLPALTYTPGQVTLGATWNRYGRPGQMLGDDWSVILAHELSHYLFGLDDVYLGLTGAGNLIPVSTCTGSAMGDLYDRPQNTEFIFDPTLWANNCASTLAHKTLGRTEWATLQHWYPALVAPTTINAGPSVMPFDLTTVTIFDPITPTNTLPDPTFYINYQNNAASAAEARAYLLQSDAQGDWLLNLGSPIGGQNRVVARGAKTNDQLCVFDAGQNQFGCETVSFGDDQLTLSAGPAWKPVVIVTPVTSETLSVSVSNLPAGLDAHARLFPDLHYAPPAIALTAGAAGYAGSFSLPQTGLLNGNLQVWVGNSASPQWATILPYAIGGDPGGSHGGAGQSRAGGGIGQSRAGGGIGQSRAGGGIGQSRAGGGIGQSRAGGGIGQARSGHAPLLSPDGQLIFFTAGNTDFAPGALFAIQSTASLPALPAGRRLIGAGYNLTAAPGAALPAGSVSIQYLANDVVQAGAREDELTLYFYDGAAWHALTTTRDPFFDVIVAPSQGPGLYAVLASLPITLEQAGWNLVAYPLAVTSTITEGLASLEPAAYTLVYGYKASDAADPWKLYAPAGAPAYVNDLLQLEPGRGYWIRATQPTTWYVAPQTAPLLTLDPQPPSTFYGPVLAAGVLTPLAGLEVTATVNGAVCGRSVTQIDPATGQVVYVVDVESGSGCGQAGAPVRFMVAGQTMTAAGAWTNAQLTWLPLGGGQRLFLPLVQH